MKKLAITILCLFLTSCGTFDIRVQILPSLTATALPASTAAATQMPALTPTMPEPGATALATSAPTSTPADEPIRLTTIQMNDANRGWGVEASGRIIKTSDGGGIWQNITPGSDSFGAHSLFAFDSQAGWAVPTQLETNNVVWRTRDGGSTWDASQSITLGAGKYTPLSLQFPDGRHGWLLLLAEDASQKRQVLLYQSADSGITWNPVSPLNANADPATLNPAATAMAFFDGQNGWIGGWWGQNDPSQWQFLKTTDGGTNWGADALRLPVQNSIRCSGHSIPEMTPGSMAMDVSCTMLKEPKYLFHHAYYLSMRTGPAWRSWVLPGELLSVDFLNASQGWMLTSLDGSPLNQVLSTQDGGKTWDPISQVAWKQAQLTFVDAKTGWALAGSGVNTMLVRTENGGSLWIQVHPFLEH